MRRSSTHALATRRARQFGHRSQPSIRFGPSHRTAKVQVSRTVSRAMNAPRRHVAPPASDGGGDARRDLAPRLSLRGPSGSRLLLPTLRRHRYLREAARWERRLRGSERLHTPPRPPRIPPPLARRE
eukprot:5236500-Prymnesium_polylepis.1